MRLVRADARPCDEERRPRIFTDRSSDVQHKPLEVPNVMGTHQCWPKHFFSHKEVPEVRTAESAGAAFAVTGGVDWQRIFGKSRISQANWAVGREGVGIAAVAGGQDAVEHIHPGSHRHDDVPFVANAH